MNLLTKHELTPTRIVRDDSTPQSTRPDEEPNRVWSNPESAAEPGWTLDLPVAQSPPEDALIRVVMTFGHGMVRIQAVDIGVAVEGRDAPTAYGRLIDAASAHLEASGDERAELLRDTPDDWLRFVPPDQVARVGAEGPEVNALYETDVPDLDALAEAQGVSPIGDIDELVADFWPEDDSAEDFMVAVRKWRDEGQHRNG
jgi:hypothetical protein